MGRKKGSGNMDLHKSGKKFTPEYQPPNENKRVPKWRTIMRRKLMENVEDISDSIIREAKEGNMQAIKFLKDYTDDVNVNINGKVILIPEEIEKDRD